MHQDDEISFLVDRAKEDPRAFAEIYEAFFEKIYNYVRYKVSNPTDAEDITELVFLRALESISGFKWKGYPFSSWLFRIAHNQVVDHFRATSRRSFSSIDDSEAALDSGVNIEAEFDLKDDAKMIQAAIIKLPPDQQDVVILKFIDGLTNLEVAKIIGKSEGAVKSLQHRAMRNLRKILGSSENE